MMGGCSLKITSSTRVIFDESMRSLYYMSLLVQVEELGTMVLEQNRKISTLLERLGRGELVGRGKGGGDGKGEKYNSARKRKGSLDARALLNRSKSKERCESCRKLRNVKGEELKSTTRFYSSQKFIGSADTTVRRLKKLSTTMIPIQKTYLKSVMFKSRNISNALRL